MPTTETFVWKEKTPGPTMEFIMLEESLSLPVQQTVGEFDCIGDSCAGSATQSSPIRFPSTPRLIGRILVDAFLITGSMAYIFAELFLDLDSPLCGLLIIGILATDLTQLRR
jgi:hypothetical protein